MPDDYNPLRIPQVTSTPAAIEGEIWYRTDLDQVSISDGQSGAPILVGPSGNVPVIRSNGWHSVPSSGAAGTLTPTLSRLFAQPLWPGRSCSLTGAAIEITLLGLGNVRAGIYADSGSNLPGSLIADFGTIATGAAGVKTFAPTPVPLRPVLHWLAVVQQGAIAVGYRTRDTSEPMVSDLAAVLSGNLNSYYIDGVAGALPGSFGVPVGTIQGPSFTVRLV